MLKEEEIGTLNCEIEFEIEALEEDPPGSRSEEEGCTIIDKIIKGRKGDY
jgi:hypothetical protein